VVELTAPVVHQGWRFDHFGIPTTESFSGAPIELLQIDHTRRPDLT
jgi:hypothetical protein